MAGPWDKYANPQGLPATIQGPPREPPPQTATDAARDDVMLTRARQEVANNPLDVEAKKQSIDSSRSQQTNTRFDNANNLRKQFEGMKPVQDYRTILPQYTSALQAGDNLAGDLQLVYAFGKIMDPGSVVREGELQMANNTGGVADRLQGYLNSLAGGSRLPGAIRQGLLQELRTRASQTADEYNQIRQQYRDIAKNNGYDPNEVIGAHPGAQFQRAEANFLHRPIRNLDGTVGAAPTNGSVPITPSNVVDNLLGRQSQPLDVEITDDRMPGETEEQYLARIQAGQAGGDPVIPTQRKDQNGFVETADAVARGVADTVSLGLADEFAAAGQTIFNGGTMRENLARERGVDTYDEQNNFGARFAGQLGGGFALPTFGATSAGGLARIGAGYGGAYGFGSGEGSITDRLINAGTGAAIGAGAGAGLGALGNRLASLRGGTGPAGGRNADLIAAAERQGVDLMPADVGGPMTRRFSAGAAQSPISAGSIVRGGQRVVDQSAAARDRAATSVGSAVDPVEAGEAAIRGAQTYRRLSREQGARLYEGAANLAGDSRIVPERARAILDRNIAELAESPTGAPAALTRLREQLAGDFTVSGLRNLRTQLRDEFAAQGLRGTDSERRGMQAVDALTDDIAAGLTAQGNPEAAEAYRAADRAWRERLDILDNAIAPIIGKNGEKSAEQAFQAIQTASRSNTARMSTFMRALPEEEQNTVRASIIGQLGRGSAGTQNAEGTAFSLNQFLTHWNQMTPRAKEALFRGEARAALDDLAKIAQGSREAASYANRSNTGGSNIGNLITGGIGVASWMEPTLLTALGTNYAAGRLLASARFARWLARAPKSPDQRYIARLGAIASREPAIAQEIIPIRQALEAATRRAAAGQEDQRRREPPK